MAGDYTRMTFTSNKDHSGVLMQQGRVTLDADWNEQVELLDHRLRAEIVDTLGRCIFSRETPDAFAIGLSGGALEIGRGRAFVDGLLAENHGAAPLGYDSVLGELYGTQPLDYLDQPYLPNPLALPTSGTHIAYLDVWQREVTHLQDPGLVEKAIGVDTATRLQTAWQVRLLAAPGGTECDSTVAAWDDLVAPSAGRLSTSAVGVPTTTDPCTIPPSGGYRGTENRLYRVEIHDAGLLGTATFKWSRDNASIASHVEAIDTARTTLTVTRLGRDGVHRLRVDDWVEVTDDWRELHGLPGELRKVATVDEVNETLTFATALPAGEFDATDPTRHTRVIRWDETGAAVDAAGGVLKVPAAAGTAIVLDADGVQISFDVDPAGGSFHVGDYWVFAARTADASVEQLVDEPPRGVKHHYCRLAVVTFPGAVVDCRRPPEEECCDCECDVCVTPESHADGSLTIQQAVDQVGAKGGKVCLQVGVYRLERPVLIRNARSLQVEGKGWKTILLAAGRTPAIVVQASIGVTLSKLTVVTSTLSRRGATPAGVAILLRNTVGTIIERCVLAQLGLLQRDPGRDPEKPRPEWPTPEEDPCPPENLKAISKSSLTLVDYSSLFGPRGAGAPLIALDGIVVKTVIKENVLVGTSGIGTLWGALYTHLDTSKAMDPGVETKPRAASADLTAKGSGYLFSLELSIEDNLLLCWLNGITLEGFSMQLGDTRITGNSLFVCLRGAIVTTGVTGPGGRIDIARNLVNGIGYGVVIGTDDTRVVDNDVTRLRGFGNSGRDGSIVGLSSSLKSPEGNAARYLTFFGGDAIVLAPSLGPRGIDRCQVRGNRVTGMVGNGVRIRTIVRSALVADNIVEAVGGSGVLMDARGAAFVLGIERNQFLNVGVLQNDRIGAAAAVVVGLSRDVTVIGNVIDGVGVRSESAFGRYGVAVSGCFAPRITGNVIDHVGPPDDFLGLSAGIALFSAFQESDVLDNTIRRSERPPSKAGSDWFGILILRAFSEADPVKEAYTGETQRLFVGVSLEGHTFSLPLRRGSLAVRGNVVHAYGEAPAVQIETPVSCLFNDNRCFLTASDVITARVRVGAAVASNNYLDGPRDAPALTLDVPAGRPFTLLGNITSGGILVNGSVPPAPWDQLNVF